MRTNCNLSIFLKYSTCPMTAALRDKRGANEVESERKREVKRGQRDRKKGPSNEGQNYRQNGGNMTEKGGKMWAKTLWKSGEIERKGV